jgi:hypothetical protein
LPRKVREVNDRIEPGTKLVEDISKHGSSRRVKPLVRETYFRVGFVVDFARLMMEKRTTPTRNAESSVSSLLRTPVLLLE